MNDDKKPITTATPQDFVEFWADFDNSDYIEPSAYETSVEERVSSHPKAALETGYGLDGYADIQPEEPEEVELFKAPVRTPTGWFIVQDTYTGYFYLQENGYIKSGDDEKFAADILHSKNYHLKRDALFALQNKGQVEEVDLNGIIDDFVLKTTSGTKTFKIIGTYTIL